MAPLLDPALGHRGGVGAEDGFLGIVALLEPDALAAAQIDGRVDLHVFIPGESSGVSRTFLPVAA